MEFNVVVCGGTFEYLHKGHIAFLRFTLSKGKKVLLGLTSDRYVRNMQKGTQAPFNERKKTLERFLKDENALERVEILSIDNLYIPKEWEAFSIDAIIATKDSQKGAEEINRERKVRGLLELSIVLCPLVIDNIQEPISSSSVRDLFNISQTLFLPDDVRAELKKPLGILIKDFKSWVKKNRASLHPAKIVTVGDVVTKACNQLSLGQKISIIDFHVGRKKKFSDIKELGFLGNEEIISVENRAGTLVPFLFREIKKMFSSSFTTRKILLIDGEEDLSVLPCVVFAPLGFYIFYGQPNEGVVAIEVSRFSKGKAISLISRFSSFTRGH